MGLFSIFKPTKISMQYRIFLGLLFGILWYGPKIQAQEIGHGNIPDSLINTGYQELRDIYYPLMDRRSTNAAFYINAHIKKAKLEKDTLEQAAGYTNMAVVLEHIYSLRYSDSIIQFTQNIKGHYRYPAMGYHLSAVVKFNIGNYQEALDDAILAHKACDPDNKWLSLEIQQLIAILKRRSGNFQEALEIHLQILTDIQKEDNFRTESRGLYRAALFNLSTGYLALNNESEAEKYGLLAIQEAAFQKDTITYWQYKGSLGEIKYKQGLTKEAIPLLTKSLPYRQEDYGLANTYVFRGKAYWDLNQKKKALFDFEKADSIVQQTQDFLPEMLGVYATLNAYYRERKQPKKQKEYIDKLIYVDSVLDADALYLSQEIKNQYDIPLLLAERQELIDGLESKTNRYSNWLYALSLTLGGAVVLGFYYRRKRLGYKKKFEALMNEKIAAAPTKVPQKIESKELHISEEVVQRVLTLLETYEQEQGYLQPGISLQNLSKTLDTNSNYLSKIINVYRGKNFSSYISDLRIAYALEALKHNSTLRRYTIKAIAAETGFGSAESFTTAFYRKTGIYPSYYIKQLNKEEKDERPLR